MPGIICAIRGGPNSRVTIEKAMDLVEQSNLPLYFLYVVSLDFLSHTMTNRVQVARDEIQKMGEFILLTAKERSVERGISSVHLVSREGKVSEEIISLCKEIQADYIILGRPVEEDENSLFAGKMLQLFLAKLETECNAHIILAGETS
jgi:nucleotide-binding universal stress UspA family protein